MGKNNGNWNGGTSTLPYSFDFNEELKMLIRKRDNFICQLCNAPAVVVHHIDYNKNNSNNSNPDNLITLCKVCHPKTNKNRQFWINYFKTKWEVK